MREKKSVEGSKWAYSSKDNANVHNVSPQKVRCSPLRERAKQTQRHQGTHVAIDGAGNALRFALLFIHSQEACSSARWRPPD